MRLADLVICCFFTRSSICVHAVYINKYSLVCHDYDQASDSDIGYCYLISQGSFIVRVKGPDGWSFEPDTVS